MASEEEIIVWINGGPNFDDIKKSLAEPIIFERRKGGFTGKGFKRELIFNIGTCFPDGISQISVLITRYGKKETGGEYLDGKIFYLNCGKQWIDAGNSPPSELELSMHFSSLPCYFHGKYDSNSRVGWFILDNKDWDGGKAEEVRI